MAHWFMPMPGLDPAVRKAPCPLLYTLASVAVVKRLLLAFCRSVFLTVALIGFALIFAKFHPPVNQ